MRNRTSLKEELFNRLNDSDISDSDGEHVKRVWKEMKLINMGEYHNLCLKSDVLILAGV